MMENVTPMSSVYLALLVSVLLIVADSELHVRNFHQYVKGTGTRVDPEVYMNVSQLITSKGYPCEEYDVITNDGYILGVQRIPHGRNERVRHVSTGRPVVLVQHGLLSSSEDWVLNLANQSLGFLLADAGFDVWLGNSRGNTYALRHQTLSTDTDAFWDFSWDEMAEFDLPATVDKVLQVTKARQLTYIGFSQGTEIAFARLSQDPELSEKIRVFIALAPVAYIGNVKSPIRLLAPFAHDLSLLFHVLGVRDFLPSDWLLKWLGRNVCGLELPAYLCENALFLFGGFDSQQINMTRLPVYISHVPAGTSVRNIVHYAQSIQSGRFQKFDFGIEENMRRYSQATPPEYYPGNITVPVALFSGTADWLATPRDLKRLIPELKHVKYHKVIQDWEHLDFTWAMDGPSACYDSVIDVIKRSNNLT